ncbi:histidine kinase [Oceanidesulfovibrio indonesiensis]|uniref:histidine kinase n=1 Tax=Oceanidesulfovibrio indonesiensis TaxID=54767 RepID=A0A7M3MEY5_9BACT|nr:HAMP domain-containing sensor histidine kinase [Oceanidesulfovibrio indonesiensis]TVM17371.1 histidine kinase [Oceanidesulfovibrio indonesiensis]
MRGGFSFRSRVLASFLLVVFLGLLVPSWYTHRIFTQGLKDNADLEIRRLYHLIHSGLGEHAKDPEAAPVFGWLESTARNLRVRLALFDEASNLIFASSSENLGVSTILSNGFPTPNALPSEGVSHTPPATMNLGVPDVRVASVYFHGDAVFASGAWSGSGALPPGRLVLGMPHYEAGGWLQDIESGMYIAVAAALLLSGLLSLFLVRWLWRCMGETIAVAEAIGSGNYMKRLGFFKSKEFDALARSINSMAQSIESHIRTITEQKSQLQAVLDSMREGVMVIDSQCRIRSVNRAFEDIFQDAADCVGKRPLEVILSPELQRACDDTLAVDAHSREEGATAVRMQIEPVRDAVYDVTIVPMRRQGGQGVQGGLVVVFHDISELSRLERIRRDFVANVSHELRTPLTSVKGYAETLLLGVEQGTAKPEGQKSFLEIIIKHANHMAKTVNDLLSLTRLESGKKPFDLRKVDAVKAAAQALRECEQAAGEKGVYVELDMPDELTVMADFDRLVQVFRNLMENAMKYGLKSEPERGAAHSGNIASLAARVWSKEENGMVTFGVEDQGPGIPAGDMERIFERFYRVDKHRTNKGAGSSGLGLAICKHIVEKLGGRLWVESPTGSGTGSCFMFTVPKTGAISDAAPAADRPEADGKYRETKARSIRDRS